MTTKKKTRSLSHLSPDQARLWQRHIRRAMLMAVLAMMSFVSAVLVYKPQLAALDSRVALPAVGGEVDSELFTLEAGESYILTVQLPASTAGTSVKVRLLDADGRVAAVVGKAYVPQSTARREELLVSGRAVGDDMAWESSFDLVSGRSGKHQAQLSVRAVRGVSELAQNDASAASRLIPAAISVVRPSRDGGKFFLLGLVAMLVAFASSNAADSGSGYRRKQ